MWPLECTVSTCTKIEQNNVVHLSNILGFSSSFIQTYYLGINNPQVTKTCNQLSAYIKLCGDFGEYLSIKLAIFLALVYIILN